MARSDKISAADRRLNYVGLRDWVEQVEGMGELLKIDGAHWDKEMGVMTQMLTENSKGRAPAILFDEI
ncbi:MAG: hypothetical protein V3W37_04115, partial [Candidatus Binatia bacterium]